MSSLNGTRVVITGARQKRPNQPVQGCPFCPGGLEAPEPYDVFSFVNRWPALPDGRAEVVLYCPQHDGNLWSLPVDHVERVVALWEERTSALADRPDTSYVLIFENRGTEVGATIAHPHGQIYAFDTIPPVARLELDRPPCVLCQGAPTTQLISKEGEWCAWVPEAASWPYEILVTTQSHVGSLPEAAHHRRSLAIVLRDVLARLDQLFDAPMPYMMWIHQRPCDGGDWPNAHVHIHLSPILRAPGVQRYVAAGELGSGFLFNPVVPEQAAASLRALRGSG